MKINKLLAILAFSAILFTSCEKEESPILPKGDYENGILISGEGSSAGTGSVSYVSNDYKTTENLIYKNTNSEELGTFLQSITFDDDKAFIIVDNQNTITVVDRYTFVKETSITTGLQIPRFMAIYGNKGYVTNWGSGSFGDNVSDDFIAIVNLDTYEVEGKIEVAVGPERIIAQDGKLYVSHKGGFGHNNIISIINISTSKVVKEIVVKDIPDELFFDNSGDLVVLSEGRTIYDASWNVIDQNAAAISKINTSTEVIDLELIFPLGESPSLLETDGLNLYYNLGGKIYKLSNSDTSLPTSEFIDTSASYLYGIKVNSEDLLILDTSFTDLSALNTYNLTTKNKEQTISVALGASKIYFN